MIRYLTELSLEHFTEAARNVPYQQIQSGLFFGADVWIRRDDLIDPLLSGNKAYKLIYNLLEARKQGKDTIVTCGGAWSNHIHATAAAGQRFGFKTVGIIRGERPAKLSATLQDSERFGMELRFVDRSLYRERHQKDFLERVDMYLLDSWFIPEGGANLEGGRGVQLLGKIIGEASPIGFDECWCPCGTGLTLAALTSSLPSSTQPVGVPVLKAEESILAIVKEWGSSGGEITPPMLISDAQHGGYGKRSEQLDAFQARFEALAGFGLDHVYTAKLAFALEAKLQRESNVYQGGHKTRVLLLHTGGLQGRRGLYGV